jgi:outer membrane protein OmpA-like peptidoglycan-associated protein
MEGNKDETAKDSASNDEFQVKDSTTAGSAHGVKESKLKPTKSEALMKFFVIDKVENKPIPGIVVSMVSKGGKKFYTEETDAEGYAEVLVPTGTDYELVYLSLGKRDVNAKVSVKDKPNQNIKLTLRYKKRVVEKKSPVESANEPGFLLDGVNFQSGKATILPESFPRLDSVLEFMTHKKSARIIITGHTDNVGKPAANKVLSEQRAQACKDYMVERGIDASRIEAVGFGDEQPVAPNETEEGRQRNRRIEAKEL